MAGLIKDNTILGIEHLNLKKSILMLLRKETFAIVHMSNLFYEMNKLFNGFSFSSQDYLSVVSFIERNLHIFAE